MIIKKARGLADDIDALTLLAQRPGLRPETRSRIDKELRIVRAGEQVERDAAYEIDFIHGASPYWAVLHDLRIEHEGLVAQIDHLLIGRFLDVWVCETKSFAGGVAINAQGEFTRFYRGKPEAIASPIEQNRKHIHLLDKILRTDKVTLPTRLGIALRPRFHSVVLVGKNGRITRPTPNADAFDSVIKSDQLRTLIEKRIDESTVASLSSMGKLVSSETLEAFATQIARLHRPSRRDWSKKFDLSDATSTASPARAARPTAAATGGEPVDARSRIDDGNDMLSTSKLGAKMGLGNVEETLARLTAAGYLEIVDGAHRLTAKGRDVGGEHVQKSRFGPYFRWPASLRIEAV